MKVELTEKVPTIFDFPGESRESGDINYWDQEHLFPNGIQRCFWVSKVKPGETRGNHAHYQESQVLVAIHGELEIEVTSTEGQKQLFKLETFSRGLFIPPLHWVSVSFSEDAILLALCDQKYSEEDYIRDKNEFDHYKKRNQ
ncbi:oxalate decarboxylase/phosphoglucose isomerase-like protein (cupin superfamily) [Algoriphagus iocasae]|jgi:oxalate decarboxylase/phosphoglucose isomerase-like protein (cupin superfamily)|uniref:Oxalate decarboxylase/phosphoglucose isomerase-like protein (Cupin superfamily) n=1 Tax=Algoriphagus iocasae TaxID=1836499 RepID=A0A841MDN4_9BACT|nr:FdtA/QdtA family cupin domain-containing protein [Algoriphagus iocasae]MBB6324853.1 oxalate decarboxylase/phosphoglucose isomerase-like protein (cupin superfamily) [Algoriphagus iocasae]